MLGLGLVVCGCLSLYCCCWAFRWSWAATLPGLLYLRGQLWTMLCWLGRLMLELPGASALVRCLTWIGQGLWALLSRLLRFNATLALADHPPPPLSSSSDSEDSDGGQPHSSYGSASIGSYFDEDYPLPLPVTPNRVSSDSILAQSSHTLRYRNASLPDGL